MVGGKGRSTASHGGRNTHPHLEHAVLEYSGVVGTLERCSGVVMCPPSSGFWRRSHAGGLQAFSVEINYLNDQRAKGKGDQDSADLMTYYESAMGKIDEFLGLYTDEKTNKYLKAYGIKGGDE